MLTSTLLQLEIQVCTPFLRYAFTEKVSNSVVIVNRYVRLQSFASNKFLSVCAGPGKAFTIR